MKLSYSEYVNRCNRNNCPAIIGGIKIFDCIGCYEEYINEKEQTDPYILNLVSQYFKKNI